MPMASKLCVWESEMLHEIIKFGNKKFIVIPVRSNQNHLPFPAFSSTLNLTFIKKSKVSGFHSVNHFKALVTTTHFITQFIAILHILILDIDRFFRKM